MRIASLLLVVSFLASTPGAAQDPPVPVPVLPAATDTAALRAALRIPLDPPDYHFHFDDTGRFDVLDRSGEAAAHIAKSKSRLKDKATDAELYDELRLWHHRLGDPASVKECASRAARGYRERLRTDPYNIDLLTRCGEALIEAADMPEAERRLRRAVAVDPNSWRAWYLLARVQIDSAYAMQALPAPMMADESNLRARRMAPTPRRLPAELRIDLPPVSEEEMPPPQPVKPAEFAPPSRVVDWAEVGKLSAVAANCLDEALAIAPHEPAVRLARCCQRKLAAEVLTMTGAAGPIDPFADPESVADARAAVTPETTDPDVIGVATWFEITAAQRKLERTDDTKFRQQTYSIVCERIEQLEGIAANAGGPTAARAALLAAHLCRKIGQPFRAGVHIRFAIMADPDSRPAREAYLAMLAESGPPSEYVTAARTAAERFKSAPFYLRWADALARSGETTAALRVLSRLQRKEPDNVLARLAEAAVRLQTEGATALPRVNDLLDAVESTLRSQPNPSGETDCALLRACSHLIGGNSALGRVLLEDLARREPWHPRVKAALAAVAE